MTEKEKEKHIAILQRIKNRDLKEILDDYKAGMISLEEAIFKIDSSTGNIYALIDILKEQ